MIEWGTRFSPESLICQYTLTSIFYIFHVTVHTGKCSDILYLASKAVHVNMELVNTNLISACSPTVTWHQLNGSAVHTHL